MYMRDVRPLINLCEKQRDAFLDCMECPIGHECFEILGGECPIEVYQQLILLDRLREKYHRKNL